MPHYALGWRDMDDDARAKAYSPSSMLAGPLEPYIARYIEESRAAYSAVPDVQTLPFGPQDTQTLDFTRPPGDRPVPLHLFIHGGYWQELSKRESFFAAPHAIENGYGFAALDYTLAPMASIDAMIGECARAVHYLQGNATSLGIDPARIVISGSSAGAHLAAMTALQLPSESKPKALILLSGIYELEPLIGTYINDALDLDREQARQLSPMLAELRDFPPCVLAWGANETEEFKLQSKCFAKRLSASNVQVDAFEIAGRNHFDIVHDFAPGAPLGQVLSGCISK